MENELGILFVVISPTMYETIYDVVDDKRAYYIESMGNFNISKLVDAECLCKDYSYFELMTKQINTTTLEVGTSLITILALTDESLKFLVRLFREYAETAGEDKEIINGLCDELDATQRGRNGQ